jgi:hypothetical protein
MTDRSIYLSIYQEEMTFYPLKNIAWPLMRVKIFLKEKVARGR